MSATLRRSLSDTLGHGRPAGRLIHDDSGHERSCHPRSGGNDPPHRPFRARVLHHLLECVPVSGPVLTLREIAEREPRLSRNRRRFFDTLRKHLRISVPLRVRCRSNVSMSSYRPARSPRRDRWAAECPVPGGTRFDHVFLVGPVERCRQALPTFAIALDVSRDASSSRAVQQAVPVPRRGSDPAT